MAMLLLGDKQAKIIRPVVALRDTVVFPSLTMPLSIGRRASVEAVKAAEGQNYEVIFVCQREADADNPSEEQLYEVGTLARIHQLLRTPSGQFQVQAEGRERVKIQRFIKTDPYYLAEAVAIPEVSDDSAEIEALRREVLSSFQQLAMQGRAMPVELVMSAFNAENSHRLVEIINMALQPAVIERQALLEIEPLKERLEHVLRLLQRELEIQNLSRKIQNRTQEELGKMQREVFLREQMKAIQKELGGEEGDEYGELEKKIKQVGMPEATEVHALKELERLRRMPSFGPEVSYIRTYLDWLVDLPWQTRDDSRINLKTAKRVLDKDHYGLEKVKERILEYLAVQQLAKGKTKAQILCFVGPPGVGKTSIGKSIAKALDRKFVRMSLGGVRDEAEIRGHRRTYVGAMPGRIIQSMKQAGTKNPVIMLDELDKLSADFRGDPSSALLEALDPEQNHAFGDHYLEVPFDLSEVFFIATANVLEMIPPALRDRLEIIVYPGYTEDEKYHIAKQYLLPKVTENHGLKKADFRLSNEALRAVIRHYTREAGVRNLERQLAAIARKVARRIAEDKWRAQTISERTLHRFLGPVRYRPQAQEEIDEVGAVQGLAVTEAGGDVLSVEVTRMPGKGGLVLTGQLGEVMKESAQAAMSCSRTRATAAGVAQDVFTSQDWHVHVPAGAIPKDGPSAGVAMATAIYSTATGIPVRHDVAMTGEITLRGRVLEIGGVKQKVLAAHRSGIRTVVLPLDNKKDLDEIPVKIRKDMNLTFAKDIDEVLDVALVQPKKRQKNT